MGTVKPQMVGKTAVSCAVWVLVTLLVAGGLIGRFADTKLPHDPGYSSPLFVIGLPAILIGCLPPLLMGMLRATRPHHRGGDSDAGWRPITARPVQRGDAAGARCLNCGQELQPAKSFCTRCGTPAPAVQMADAVRPCTNCGKPVGPNKPACPYCGHRLLPAAPIRSTADPAVMPASPGANSASTSCANPACGRIVPVGKRFCPACGTPVAGPPAA